MNKPGHKSWPCAKQQVLSLRSQGVSFNLMSEEEAEFYLQNNCNLFRVKSYRANFDKAEHGSKAGKFTNLDFGMLVDLSTVDMHFRNALMPLTLDIEHFYKMKLLSAAEANREDGYRVVQDFLNSSGRQGVIREIERGLTSPYTKSLIEKRKLSDYDLPVWELVEAIPFGRFIHFYNFCGNRFNNKQLRDDFYLLQSIKGLRNCCAHNNCILNDMRGGNARHRVQNEVSRHLSSIGIKREMKRTKMNNERFQQIASTLYAHSSFSSKGIIDLRGKQLREFVQRMTKNYNYYHGNSTIESSFAFIENIIFGCYPEKF